MDDDGPGDAEQLRAFLEPGSEIVGAVAGAGIGLIVGGPPGAVLGAAAPAFVTRAVRWAVAEAMHRQLSLREQTRIAAVTTAAAARIQRSIALGREPRADGFFQGTPGQRSAAEELAEGVLVSAQREHEEKKIPYLGNLLANLAFAEGINRGAANFLLRWADRLSYRQICLLALIGRKEEFPALRDGDFQDQLRDPPPEEQEGLYDLVGILEEAEELFSAGMLTQQRNVLFGRGVGLNPTDAELWRWGWELYELMDLSELPAAELQPLADVLS